MSTRRNICKFCGSSATYDPLKHTVTCLGCASVRTKEQLVGFNKLLDSEGKTDFEKRTTGGERAKLLVCTAGGMPPIEFAQPTAPAKVTLRGSRENPHLSKEYLDTLEREFGAEPKAFERYVLGEWTTAAEHKKP